MIASLHWLRGRIASSRARSLLAYLIDMSRRSLRGDLRFIPLAQWKEAI